MSVLASESYRKEHVLREIEFFSNITFQLPGERQINVRSHCLISVLEIQAPNSPKTCHKIVMVYSQNGGGCGFELTQIFGTNDGGDSGSKFTKILPQTVMVYSSKYDRGFGLEPRRLITRQIRFSWYVFDSFLSKIIL